MRLSRQLIVTLVLAALLCLLAPVGESAETYNAVNTLNDYFELLESGNFETAGYLWTEEAQERAARFGIEYEGIPVKADCISPVVQHLDALRYYLHPPVKRYEDMNVGDCVYLEFSKVLFGNVVKHDYHAQLRGDYYWLTFAQDCYADAWPVLESKYFRVHYHPDMASFLHPVLMLAADEFVESVADSLDIDNKMLETIADYKIEYFYCNSDSTVEAITGQLTKGLLDLASNDVISADFPHFHEVTHLMVNIKLQRLPLFTLPLLREGVAVLYGGRWGKAPAALMDLGVYLYKEQLVFLDSMLTYRSFMNGSGADISYPVAGLFSAYLIDKLGQKKYFELYLDLSGDSEGVSGLDYIDVTEMILSYTGHKDWLDLTIDFDDFLDVWIEAHAAALPGALDDGKTALEKKGYTVKEDKHWFGFEFVGGNPGAPTGNLLFGLDPDLVGRKSLLFDQQYEGKVEFEGYRFGVRFDQYEAGLYDYATNRLMAKYIWGVTPSVEYFDKDANRIAIRIRKDLLGSLESDKVKCRLLSY